MSKLFMLALIFALPASALAHIEPGTWKGQTKDGKECSMQAFEQSFAGNGQPHPLNERFRVQVNGEEFLVGHPPVLDEKSNEVFFNHNALQAVNPTDTGANALIVAMVHSQTFEGPISFHWMGHAWKKDVRTGIECLNLIHQN